MIGLIADIHANHWALERVFEAMPPAVDRVVCCGDIVGYGPDPAACVRLVRERADVVVQGNHDRYVSDPRFGFLPGIDWPPKHARLALSADQMEWLRSLPRQCLVDGYLAVHRWPGARRFELAPTDLTVDAELDDIVGVLKGHAHRQRELTRDGRQIINPGVVGEPRPTKFFPPTRASLRPKFAVLDPDDGSVSFRQTSYVLSALKRAVGGRRQAGETGR